MRSFFCKPRYAVFFVNHVMRFFFVNHVMRSFFVNPFMRSFFVSAAGGKTIFLQHYIMTSFFGSAGENSL